MIRLVDERLALLCDGEEPKEGEIPRLARELLALRMERDELTEKLKQSEAALAQSRRDLGAWKELAASYQSETAELSSELHRLRMADTDEGGGTPQKRKR
jgi:chromosome segregation ATPase